MEHSNKKIKRLLDANFNRAREGLRVIEDIARFVLDDKEIACEIKQIRSDISMLQESMEDAILNRDTANDIGTSLSSKKEEIRKSIKEIVKANAKRAQESLRVLEEVLKLHSSELAKIAKQLRYKTYQIEKEIIEALKS